MLFPRQFEKVQIFYSTINPNVDGCMSAQNDGLWCGLKEGESKCACVTEGAYVERKEERERVCVCNCVRSKSLLRQRHRVRTRETERGKKMTEGVRQRE